MGQMTILCQQDLMMIPTMMIPTIMIDQTYFRGKSVKITGDVSDFNDIDFDNSIASVKIEGNCCWALLTDANYKGDLAILNGPGEYQSGNDFREVFKKASSARNKCS